MMTIYHNPRCRKSREALALLREHGVEPSVVEYLKTPLDQSQLQEVLGKLNLPAEAVIRKGEAEYKSEYKGKELDEAGWIAALEAHPKLLERPIVVSGERAVVGRPPEKVLELLP